MIRRTVLLSLSGFFLAILAVALDRHEDAFFLNTCSICKVKTSLSGTASKYKINFAPAMTVASRALTAGCPLRADAVHGNRSIAVVSQTTVVWPNKAPPVRSSFNNRWDFTMNAAGKPASGFACGHGV